MRRTLLALAAVATLMPLGALPARAAHGHALTCFPLAPADIRYDNTWGAARSGGRGHQGTDIMAPKQTVVMAVADGVVETLDTASGAGYYVRLVHPGGWETWYMHLDNDSPRHRRRFRRRRRPPMPRASTSATASSPGR